MLLNMNRRDQDVAKALFNLRGSLNECGSIKRNQQAGKGIRKDQTRHPLPEIRRGRIQGNHD